MSEAKNEAKEKRPPGMMLYFTDANALECLNGDDYKAVFVAMFAFAQNGEMPDGLSDVANLAFLMIKPKIEADMQRYSEKCEKNRQNIRARWDKKSIRPYTTEYDRVPIIPITTPNAISNTISNKGVGDESSKRPKRFSPPTVLQVQEYCAEKGYSVDAERFVDFYASKGWRVGNTPMKDWQAAVRTWAKKEGGKVNGFGMAKHTEQLGQYDPPGYGYIDID